MYCFSLRIQFTSSIPIKPSQSFAYGFWTHYNLYLLTCVVNYPAVAIEVELLFCKFCHSGETFQCICTGTVLLDDVIRRTKRLTCTYSWDPLTILKHWSMTLTFLIIWELVRPLVTIDSRNVTDWLRVAVFWITGWHCLAVIHCWFFGGLWKAVWVSASVMLLFWLQNLSVWKKFQISWN